MRTVARVATALWVATAAAAGAQPHVGLYSVRTQRFGNENLLGFYTPEAGDIFGFSLATGDFNHDGADDLATGVPLDDGLVGSEIEDSGSVVVRYGIPRDGLFPRLAGTVLRQTPAVDPADAGDFFGGTLAACDFNGDQFDDLAVGISNEDHLGRTDAGAVQIHYGGTQGINLVAHQFYTESTDGVAGSVEEFDRFGWSLACGDFNGDGFDDLAVGVPLEKFETTFGINGAEGMVNILPGTAFGVNPLAAGWSLKVLHQDVSGMPGEPEVFDLFGWDLGAGDFNADGFADLAIGVPGEDEAGYVQVVFGSSVGLTTSGNVLVDEAELGGVATGFSGFGSAFATGDFNADGFDDLVVGAPHRPTSSGVMDAGGAAVLFGAPGGFAFAATQFWDEDAIGFPGVAEEGDNFGMMLAAGDFDRDGFDDVAFGHPGETLLGSGDGAITVIKGSAAGLVATRRRTIVPGKEGFPGDFNQTGKAFAASLASGDFDGDGHADLAVGSPREDVGGIEDVGSEMVLYGALFADGVETGDTAFWSETVGTTSGNRIRVSTAAKLGPSLGRFGLDLILLEPPRQPAPPAYVRVGPEAGFRNEVTLRGSFFIDPQNLSMSPNPTFNAFDLMTFTDGVGAGSTTRLRFELNRTDANGWSILVSHFNDNVGALTSAGGASFTAFNDPNGHNTRIEFEWRAGDPGHLTMWKTRFVDGVPDNTGRVMMLSANLPGMQRAVINHVFAGMIAGQDISTHGSLYLDELSFGR